MQPLCIILGGGQGKRLYPLTRERAKPAVPIAGKYRLVDIPISNALNSGLLRIFVLTQFNSVSLHRHIMRTYRFDAFHDASVDLLAAQQTLATTDWFQGTADAVRKNMAHYHLEEHKEVVILSGDQLYQMDLRDVLAVLRSKRADFVVAAVPVKREATRHVGVMRLARDGRIVGFQEKPMSPAPADRFRGSYLASMGIYAFKTRVLQNILAGEESDFGRELIPNAIARYRAYAYIFNGYWRDIGTIKSFYEASLDLTGPAPSLAFNAPGQRIYTHPRFLPPLRVHASRIERCLLSEGSVIEGATLTRSVIGLRSIIRKDAVIRDAIVMGADYYESNGRRPRIGIGRRCVIERAILDKNVRLGDGVRITNSRGVQNADAKNYFIRDGIVVIPKNAVVASGSHI